MRVATRRLRSTLKSYRPLWDRAATDHLRAELKWLADALGKVRDADVMVARLERSLEELPPELVVGPVAARLTGGLRAQGTKDHRTLVSALNGQRYAALLDELDALLAAAPTDKGLWPAKKLVPRRVRRAVGDRRRAAGHRGQRSGAAARRCQACSTATRRCTRPASRPSRPGTPPRPPTPVGGSGATRLAAAMEDLQELLGEQHDSVVTRQLLRTAGMQAFGAGENAFTLRPAVRPGDRHGPRRRGPPAGDPRGAAAQEDGRLAQLTAAAARVAGPCLVGVDVQEVEDLALQRGAHRVV